MNQPLPQSRAGRCLTTLLLGLLVILALRLTISEFQPALLDRSAPTPPAADGLPELGPGTTVGFTVVVFLLAGGAAFIVRWSRRDVLYLLLIAAILGCAAVSTLSAANRYIALIGTCDLATALVAGFAMSLLARDAARQRLVFAVLVALLAVFVVKAAYEYFYDIPETIADYQQDKEKVWKEHGWQPGDPSIGLFEARMNSRMITGFMNLSNVFAAAVLPGITAAAAGLWLLLCARRTTSAAALADEAGTPAIPRRLKKATVQKTDPAHDLRAVLIAIFGLLLAAGFAVQIGAKSRGASIAGVAAVIIVVALLARPQWTVRRRKLLLLIGIFATVLLVAGVLLYGFVHHRLPTESLAYRWHYWTAAAHITRDYPFLGVGLNNFGAYYFQYKLPYSPEDVTDPHSFFVRFAAELGIPAACLIAALSGMLIYHALRANPRGDPTNDDTTPEDEARWNALFVPAGFCIVWWVSHLLLADLPQDYWYILDFFFAIAGFMAFLVATVSWQMIGEPARMMSLAIFGGALAMLMYDQINMALVTGPVAMLFWMTLALPQRVTPANVIPKTGEEPGTIQRVGATAFVVAGLTVGFLFWIPITQERFRWDPTPDFRRAQAALSGDQPHWSEGLAALDSAIAKAPRAIYLIHERIQVRAALHLSTADDIRTILRIEHSTPRLHRDLAVEPSDLPMRERIAALREGLYLDEQLDPKEPKRFTAAERAQAEKLLDAMVHSGAQ